MKLIKRFSVIFSLILFYALISCNSNNESFFQKFEREFYDSIALNKAVKHKYNYDPLTPQNSYFINHDLKYLEYTHNPEIGKVQNFVFFDLNTDSISRIIRRRIKYKVHYTENKLTDDFTDTIIVVSEKTTSKYAGGRLLKTSFDNHEFKLEREFIKKMKLATEKNYNDR